jgi:hypothetical protein
MALWDRVSGAAVRLVPPDATPGRYVADEAGDVRFGRARAEPGDQLCAGPAHGWSATLPGRNASTGHFAPADVIEDAEQSALNAMSAELIDADGKITWRSLRTAAPFKRPPPDQLEPTQTDRAIAIHGPHLLEVVRAPHKHLDSIVEPVHPGLARRIPPQAIEHLAEHSEDWQRRTVRAVIPRRVLSQRADEQLDVYENRLVARTIDRLLAYLSRRGSMLSDYREQFDTSEQDDLGSPHWLARRLAALWGTTFDTDEQRNRLKALQEQLEERRRRIGGLQDSALYKAVPRRASVGGRLRTTNVLTNHQHYRRVVALWRVLDDAPTLTARDAYEAAQRALRAFDAFTLALIAHSLDGFGYAPRDASSLTLTSAGELPLDGPRGPLVLRWDPLRGAVLHRDDVPLLRLIPLATRLAGTVRDTSPRDPAWIEKRVQALLETVDTTQALQTVVLYPGRSKERLPARLATLLNPPDAGIAREPSCALLPVSPLDLYSAERVDRVVRRVVLIDLFERFPPRVACARVAIAEAAALVSWLSPNPTNDELLLLSTPDPSQREQLRVRAQERASALRQPRDRALRDALAALPNAVEQATASLASLQACPTCGANGTLLPWVERDFKLTCPACASSWGLRPCAACDARIPFLELNAKQRPERDPVAQSEQLDHRYGRDVLAIPRADTENKFKCPACGA